MKHRITIIWIHDCGKEWEDKLGHDDVRSLLDMLEKHSIPFEHNGKREDSSTPGRSPKLEKGTAPGQGTEK